MKKFVFVGLPLAFLGGCTASNPTFPPEVTSYRSPADAHTGIRRSHYHNVVGRFTQRADVEPTKWRERNAVPSSWRDQNVEPASPTESAPVTDTAPAEEPSS